MKTKLTFFIAVLGLLGGQALPAVAQMTTGKPSAKVIRTGNRPEAGDFGIYLGATSEMFNGIIDKELKMQALPLINFKYMVSDQFEARVGLELYKTSSSLKGTYTQDVDEQSFSLPSATKNSSSNAMFYPGVAWHFSSKNILDVYVGAELPIGWDSSTSLSESGTVEMVGETGNYMSIISSSTTTKRAFVIGIGAFIGIQAFIADLPLALGAEFGISSKFDTGVKYKHVEEVTGNDTQTYYSSAIENLPGENVDYDSLKARTGEIGGQFRFTLTYYFK